MIIWIDAQLSPAIAAWISSHFAVDAVAVRDHQRWTQLRNHALRFGD